MPLMRIERPGPGQESVWDYPRPPVVQATDRLVRVVFAGSTIAETSRALRLLETGHAPAYFIPFGDVHPDVLLASGRVSYYDFEGEALHYDVKVGQRLAREAAWSYLVPRRGYEMLADRVAFSPSLMDQCFVDGELVKPEPDKYHGGWVTADIVGPFIGQRL